MRTSRALLAAICAALVAGSAAAQFDGAPDMRPHAPRGALNRPTWGATYYGGTNSTRTYDPGTSTVTLDSMSITIPAATVARTFVVIATWVSAAGGGGFASNHGVRSSITLDGNSVGGGTQGWVQLVSGEAPYATIGPQIVVVPGDGATHTIALGVSDSGATGNLTFNQRWISATQASQ